MSTVKAKPLSGRTTAPIIKTGRAWAELDRAALRHNIETLKALLPDGCELMPAVKANAYGHGSVLIARELNSMGVSSFCVATAKEGAELRRGGIRGLILILGYTHPEEFPLLGRWQLTQTVVDYDYAKLLNGSGEKYSVHIGVDTGMHRLGERCEDIDAICGIFMMENLSVDGIYTHLCSGDSRRPEDVQYTIAQGRSFYRLIAQLKSRGFTCPKVHILNSGGLLNFPELAGDYARVGIALYGTMGTRTETESCGSELRPVMSIKARVALVKDLHPGEGAGYGLAFVAERETKIAVLTIGYADGLPRSLSCGVGSVLIHGQKAPVIGRICMDQTLIDVTSVSDASAGDIAVIIGESGNERISACDMAEQAGTITNEIFSRLGERLERIMV